ncbi:MAG TPA: hypothetical protein VFP76_01690 [Gemmatimonadota bacterium]|nr:hypothetical protein [Gemmatimonadota bacterium]
MSSSRAWPPIMMVIGLLVLGCGPPEAGESADPENAADPPGSTAGPAGIRFVSYCSATSPNVTLVTPAEAPEWRDSEAAFCVLFEDTPDHYGNFDPLGLEGPCGGGDTLPPWESSKELYVVVTATDEANYNLHIATRIEETDDERCVGCYPEEAGCTGPSSYRDLSRDVTLTMPEGGGSRVVPLTEIQGLDYAGEVLSLELSVDLLDGDRVVGRETLAPVWARCC